MLIQKEFDDWTGHDWNKPWIAKVIEFPREGPPVLQFGKFWGDAEEGGYVEIDAEVDDIIRFGHKDHAVPGAGGWYKVTPSGDLEDVGGMFSARILFNKKRGIT